MPDIIDHADVDNSILELSGVTGVPASLIWAAVRDHAPGGLGDEASLAAGIATVTAALVENGVDLSGGILPDAIREARPATEAEQELGLSAAYAESYVTRAEDGTLVELAGSISESERRALAARGHALPDGSYPIPDTAHLHSAAHLAASGHGDVAAAKKLIRKRAAALGVDVNDLEGFGDGDSDDVAATSPYGREQRFALSDADYPEFGNPEDPPMSPADTALLAAHRRAIAAGPGFRKHFEQWFSLNPAQSHLVQMAAGDGDGDDAASEADRIVRRNAHIFDVSEPGGAGHDKTCPPGCVRDHRQNPKHVSGMSGHSEVDAIIGRNRPSGMFGSERPQNANGPAHL